MKLSERLIKYAQDYATKEGYYLEVTKELTNELIAELETEKKALAEKAFNAGRKPENFNRHGNPNFEEWYKQEIEV